jgi:serine/threonine-protein kinase
MAGTRAPGRPEGGLAAQDASSDRVRAPTAAPFATGTLLDGKFRVAGVLGTGSMGVVYEIVHEETRQRRALRVLPGGGAGVDEALREAAAAGKLRHPHLVEVFETGRLEGGPAYLLMELLQGVALAQRIRETGGLAMEEVGEVLGQACEGLQAAHDASIVHRDLRPEKLFITSGAGRPLVKLLDFGLGRLVAPAATERAYAAPEQLADASAADARCDVYSLGVILYEAVAGKHPGSGEPPPLDKVRSRLPSTLGELVSAAMSADRARRPPTARALGDALRVIVRDASVDPLGKTLPVTDGFSPFAIEPPPRARVTAAASAAGASAGPAVASAEAAPKPSASPPSPRAPAHAPIKQPGALARAIVPRRFATRLTVVVVVAIIAAVATALLLRRIDPRREQPRPSTSAPR